MHSKFAKFPFLRRIIQSLKVPINIRCVTPSCSWEINDFLRNINYQFSTLSSPESKLKRTHLPSENFRNKLQLRAYADSLFMGWRRHKTRSVHHPFVPCATYADNGREEFASLVGKLFFDHVTFHVGKYFLFLISNLSNTIPHFMLYVFSSRRCRAEQKEKRQSSCVIEHESNLPLRHKRRSRQKITLVQSAFCFGS